MFSGLEAKDMDLDADGIRNACLIAQPWSGFLFGSV